MISFRKILFSLVTCLVLESEGEAYETYVVESMCGSGTLNVSLESSGHFSTGILKATEKISYSLQMQCSIFLVAPPKHFIMVSIREIGFRTFATGACKDYLQINSVNLCKSLYREDEIEHYESATNEMKIDYYTSPDQLDNKTMSEYSGFFLVFTALRKASDKDEPCAARSNTSEIFLCDNDFCIWSGLTCDGHNNCGDLSDEDPYGNSKCGRTGRGSTVLIILGVLILLVLIIMCVATLVCSKNETVRRLSTRLRSRTVSFIPKLR